MLIFLNDRPVRVPPGERAAAVVAACDDALGRKLREGAAYLTDGRGIRLEPETPLFEGAIIRVVTTARTPRNEADAHA